MMCCRSIGISARRATTAARRAVARYSDAVKPDGSSVKPTFSIPTDCVFTAQLPECQAMSCSGTSSCTSPLRETTKLADAGARVAEPRDRAEKAALADVDDDEVDAAERPLSLRVV